MKNNPKENNSIKSKLVKLQLRGSLVMVDLRRSQLSLYLYLSELYFWWRSAVNVKGYLEKQYATLGRKFKTVTYGTNFSPLLWLAFGNNNLDRNSVDRYSRAMSAIHKEYESKPDLYAKDSVAKLANFIFQSGGLTKLSGYVAPDADTESDAPQNDNKKMNKDKQQTTQALLELTKMLGKSGEMHFIANSSYLKSTPTNFSLLLVQHTENGFNIIDSNNDLELVDMLLAQNLKQRFDVTTFPIRPLLELLQTQCWPKHLEGIVDRLVDITRLKGQKNKQFTSYRRVLYRPRHNQFILSPMNAYSGVVSIVEPFFKFLLEDCKNEVFLPIQQRAALESELLRNFEFNLYNVVQQTPFIPKFTEENSASHVVHLRHLVKPNQFVTLSFWPYYSSVKDPQDQVLIDPDYTFTPHWNALVGHHEIKRINDSFLSKWLASFAQHLTRNAHALIKVTFTPRGWLFEFVYQNGQFENFEVVRFNMLEVSDQTAIAQFAPKDLIPALKCLADLPITTAVVEDPAQQNSKEIEGTFIPEEAASYQGGVSFELNEHLLRIKFCTLVFGGSEHTIYIPTVDLEGNRATKPFIRYHPEIIDDPLVSADNDALLEDEWPEAAELEL